MDRERLVRALIMDAIADDYEDFSMIVSEVGTWAAERGISVTPAEISAGLTTLIEAGLAKAYRLSDTAEEVVPYEAGCEGECYFWLTPKGKAAIEEY